MSTAPTETTLFWHAECTTGMSIDFKTTGEHRPDLPAAVPINCPGCHGEHESVQVTEAAHEAYKADCEGSAQCPAYYHDHGCFADLDGSQCREPEAHTNQSAMTPEMFGGRDVDGIQMQILGDDGECFAALGHVDRTAFAAAASKVFVEQGGDADEPFEAGDALHRWAALEPAFEGSPDDEWSLRWVDEKTAGAFQVTTIDVSAL